MITVSSSALEQLEFLLTKDPSLRGFDLRLSLAEGGCSGFSYSLFFDQAQEEDEIIYLSPNLNLAVDTHFLSLLDGSEIDYLDSLMGGGFVVHNPQALSTCSCGQSFQAPEGGNPKSCRV